MANLSIGFPCEGGELTFSNGPEDGCVVASFSNPDEDAPDRSVSLQFMEAKRLMEWLYLVIPHSVLESDGEDGDEA